MGIDRSLQSKGNVVHQQSTETDIAANDIQAEYDPRKTQENEINEGFLGNVETSALIRII